MVYYGRASKGCERCRERKVKCDQRKPACMKCESSRKECPGYRDLNDVLFVDENCRIVRKSRQIERNDSYRVVDMHDFSTWRVVSPKLDGIGTSPPHESIRYALSPSIHEQGAQFFFANYNDRYSEPPFARDYNAWLSRSYLENRPDNVLRLVIEAIGMSGLSNVFMAPEVAIKSRETYDKALRAMKEVLNDTEKAVSDPTFLAVILFGLYEMVNIQTWEQFNVWATHLKGAMALLQLRGEDQLDRELGGLLYVHIRSQILSMCVQQHMCIPPILVQLTYKFETSRIKRQWRKLLIASPESISEIGFRIVNLRAAVTNGTMAATTICETAMAIDRDLEVWRTCVSRNWHYTTANTSQDEPDTGFMGKVHSYPSMWIAEVWTNWRILRIMANQFFVKGYRLLSTVNGAAQMSVSIEIIRQLSIGICISVSWFDGTPRKASLIEPLYVIAQERDNSREVREYAINQLRIIDGSLGIRQARLIAERASGAMNLEYG